MKFPNVSFPNDVHITKWPCPYCGAPINAAAEVNGVKATPKTGDLMTCYYCGGFSEVDSLGLPVKLKDFDGLEQYVKDQLNLAKMQIERKKHGTDKT